MAPRPRHPPTMTGQSAYIKADSFAARLALRRFADRAVVGYRGAWSAIKSPPVNVGETPVTAAPLAPSVLDALARYDTPTICNAMEVVAPERRLIGYTTKPLVCPFPDLPPMVGYARTVTIRSVVQSGLPAAEQSKRRIDYYEYVGTGLGPRITVIQDIDGPDAGYGAFWGEVQSSVHKALGCLGVITHGAIVIPIDIAAKLPDACELCGRRETPILEIARAKDFSLDKLKDALKRSAEIH